MFILYVILSVLWLYLLWTRRHLYVLSWKMPGPPCYIPIVGNILSMWNEEGLSIINNLLTIVLVVGDSISSPMPTPISSFLRLLLFSK